ncbi:DsbA family oxidoreductase [Pseudomonas sichuanensis]|uniref:DsbA family oxidoreductase n=1 Tax=Pseudomonas sichuanensis TaxID=2213015 RepID=UPI000DA690B3|nr:DsbA family oxidoreductase [Pseudomonas sichuanensis]
MNPRLCIDVTFDFICPWCLIGQRQLQRALERLARERPAVSVTVRWQGVQLLPGLPAEGVPFDTFYRQRLGSDEAVRQRQAHVIEAALAVGEPLDFTRIRRMPNTANAHRLLQRVQLVAGAGPAEVLRLRLFQAYFQEGRDLGDRSTLLEIAQACGVPQALVADCLRDDGAALCADESRVGSVVPSFVINRQRPVSGAQPAEVLYAAMKVALAQAVPA